MKNHTADTIRAEHALTALCQMDALLIAERFGYGSAPRAAARKAIAEVSAMLTESYEFGTGSVDAWSVAEWTFRALRNWERNYDALAKYAEE